MITLLIMPRYTCIHVHTMILDAFLTSHLSITVARVLVEGLLGGLCGRQIRLAGGRALVMSIEATGSATERGLLLLVVVLATESSGSGLGSGTVSVAGALLMIVTARAVMLLLTAGGDYGQRFLDLGRDWGRCGQVVAHGTVAVLIGCVRDGVGLAVIAGVRVAALDGDARLVAHMLQLTLRLGLDAVSSFITA